VKKKTSSKGITLKTVIDHIQAFQQRMEYRFTKIDERFTKIDQRFDKIDQRFAWLDLRIGNIDERLDTIEVAIIEQNHEGRIRKCEKAITALSRR
jgi:predicted  nucleic acid-binding Zn-ribbon protein